MTCDGCTQLFDPATLTYVHDYNHEVRYCVACVEVYTTFVRTCQAEEIIRQRALDLWMIERRTHVPLRTMPIDFPPRASAKVVVHDATPLVLG